MKNNLTPARRAAVLVSDAALLFLGLWGLFFSLISAFQLKAEFFPVSGVCALCAAVLSILFSLRRRWVRALLCLLILLGLGAAVWRYWPLLRMGALVAARQTTGVFAKALDFGAALDITPWLGETAPAEEIASVTALCLAAIPVLGLWTGWLFLGLRSFWLGFWGTFPLLAVPLAIEVTPSFPALGALLLFWAVGLLIRLPRRQDLFGSAKAALALFLPVALLLWGIWAAFPPANYVQPDWAGDLRANLMDWATRLSHGPSDAGKTLGLASGSADVNLSKAGPLSYDGHTVLRVESERTGHIYLRGFSAAAYQDGGWRQLSEEDYAGLSEGWPLETSSGTGVASSFFIPGIGSAQPLNFPALASSGPASRIVVENVGAPDRFVYTPYQLLTTPDRMGGAEFVGDAYLARGAGVWKHILYARESAAPQSELLLASGADVAESELNYRFFVYRNYLQVPEEVQESIFSMLRAMALDPNSYGFLSVSEQRLALSRQVSDYLASVAVYDPDTPAPTGGEDYVACFLREGRGYCMHFATAATLMLRAMGVPARYVSGYVADTAAGKRVDVPDSNAHAWVEIYVDGYGWHPVEVTPGFDGSFPWENSGEQPSAAPRPSASPAPAAPPSAGPRPTAAPHAPHAAKRSFSPWLLLPAAFAALIAVLFLRQALMRRWRAKHWRCRGSNRAVIDMYGYAQRLVRHVPDLAMPPVLDALAKKARFSRHTLTEAERQTALREAESLAAQAAAQRGLARRLWLRYLLALL